MNMPSIVRLLALIPSLMLVQCALPPKVQISPPDIAKVSPKANRDVSPYAVKKKLFVFLDGTNNQWDSRTNVRRLFETIAAREDPSLVCCYINGVGTGSSLTLRIKGLIFGEGMMARILEGYSFLSRHYQAGDEIYIFGFSRGALQARALAGLVSFSGLLPADHSGSSRELQRVWDYCRHVEETKVSSAEWVKAVNSRTPPCPLYMKNQAPVHGRYAEIQFLGVWDTVPGSQLKEYGRYQESNDDRKEGTRYKIGAYPPIKQVAHAMSIDERRSEFKAVQVDPRYSRIVPGRKLEEVWFPGVHSDVGGGYDDANALAGVSMNWMIERLNAAAHFRSPLVRVYQDVRAPQHESFDDFPGNLLSHSEPRSIPKGAIIDQASVDLRKKATGLYIRQKTRKGQHCSEFELLGKYDPVSLRPENRPVLPPLQPLR